MRRRWLLGGWVAAVAGALVLAGCSAHLATRAAQDTPTSAFSTAVHPSDFAAIRTVLAARARAVVDGDERAFLATVDDANSSFYEAQKVVFENLSDLPVTSMSYEVGDSGLPSATGIEGGPLLRPEIVEHVFFAGTNKRPVGNEVDETFVKRSGHWLLAADSTDPAATGGDSARPWAGPRLDVVTRGHLIVVTDASTSGAAQQLADTVTSDIRFDARILGVPVDDHLMVDATTSGSVSQFSNHESAAAVTFAVAASKDFRSTAVAGLRVKVNPTEIPYLSREPALMRHELTHYLMFTFSGLNPKWLTEGLAEYVSHQPAGLASGYLTDDTYNRLINRPRELTLSSLFGTDPSTDYPLAMACVTYLVDHGGMSRLKTLMSDYAAYADGPFEDAHTDQVLRKVYGMTGDQVAQGAFHLLEALR